MSVRKYPAGPETEATCGLALEAAGVGLLVIERIGGGEHAAGAFGAHLGLSSSDEPGLRAMLDRVTEADRPQLTAQIAAWRKGEPVSADFATEVTDGDGRRRALKIRLVPRAETLLLVTTCEAAHQPDVLRALSHALRSPLNALLGWVHVLALKRAHDEDVAAIAVRLERSGKALLRTVNDLQDLDHLKRGKFRLERRPFNVVESIEAAVQAQEDSAALREIRLIAEISKDCDCGIEGDPLRLRQLFEHLLRNAIHHSESGSEIRIGCARIDAQLQIKITDTGSGLTRDQIDRLFQSVSRDIPFESPGLGAGVTLARAIVERHRGTLSAESQGPGKGLTVIVTLPARLREEQKKAG